MTTYAFQSLFDFTRTTSGTFVGSNGLIQTTPASVNLLLQTQAIGSSPWLQNTTTPTLNSAIAPDGTSTASLITLTSASNFQTYQNTSVLTGAITMSCYIKTGSITWIQFFYGGSNSSYANFNVSNGTLGAFTGAATITSVGNGWYRCTHTFTPSTNSSSVVINTVDSGTAARAAITASSSGTWYLWGAQLQTGSTATDYTRNNGGVFPARFDYDPVTLAPKGILIEEQRTNLLLASEDITAASWLTAFINTRTANTTTSPTGTVTADTLTEDTSNNRHIIYQTPNITVAGVYTFSVFLKQGTGRYAQVQLAGVGGSYGIVVDLTNGAITSTNTGAGTTGAASSVTNYGNGWYRISASCQTATGTIYPIIAGSNLATPTYDANGNPTYTGTGQTWLVWGGQVEAGSFATSYIPTVASQVTRTADQCSIVAPMFAPWYNQSEGTFVVGADGPAIGTQIITQADDGTQTERITGRFTGATSTLVVVDNNAGQASLSSGTITANVPQKLAYAYKLNDFALVWAGLAAVTDTAGTLPTPNVLRVGVNASGTEYLNGHIRSIQYYPVRLADFQLQALTA